MACHIGKDFANNFMAFFALVTVFAFFIFGPVRFHSLDAHFSKDFEDRSSAKSPLVAALVLEDKLSPGVLLTKRPESGCPVVLIAFQVSSSLDSAIIWFTELKFSFCSKSFVETLSSREVHVRRRIILFCAT